MEPSDILRDLWLASSGNYRQQNSSNCSDLVVKLNLQNATISRGEPLTGHISLASSNPKDSISVGLSLMGEVKLIGHKKQLSDSLKSTSLRRLAANNQKPKKFSLKFNRVAGRLSNWEPPEGEVREEEKESDYSSVLPHFGGKQEGSSDSDEIIEEPIEKEEKPSKKFLKFKSQVSPSSGSNGKESDAMMHPSLKLIKCRSPSVGSSENADQPGIGGMRIPENNNPFLNMFQIDFLVYSFDRAIKPKTPMEIPFKIILPDTIPYSDIINFKESDQITSKVSRIREPIETFWIEYSLCVFTEEEKKKKTRKKHERLFFKVERTLAFVSIPSQISMGLSIEEAILEKPSFFSFFKTSCCSNDKLRLGIKFLDLNQLEVSMESDYFKSDSIYGFHFMIECEIRIDGQVFSINLWESVYLPVQEQPVQMKKTINKNELRLIPSIDFSLFRSSHRLKVVSMKKGEENLRVTQLVASYPIDFEWFLVRSESRFRLISGPSMNLNNEREMGHSFLQGSIDSRHQSTLFDQHSSTKLPFVLKTILHGELGIFDESL